MTNYQFNVLLDGAYTRAPYAGKRKSNFITLSNEHYDPIYGQRALEDQVDTMIALERLGFDGGIVSEQHNGPIGLLGNPTLVGAYVAARTSRIRIGIVGSLINSYLNPVRMAEEIAILDTLSRGRLTFGLPLGHGMQHHSVGLMNPGTARARFKEAHELLMAALTRTGPFEWKGDFFNVPYVNLWPRPVQQPHPPVFLPGGGSVETVKLAAKHRYTYQAALSPRPALLKTLELLRQSAQEEGYTLDPQQIALVVSVHVAESDKQARRDAEAHELWQYQNFFRSPAHDNFPPGYISAESLRRALEGGYRSTPLSELTLDDIIDLGWAIVGSPETVASKLKELLDEADAGQLVLSTNPGSKPNWLTMKSLTMFAEEVIPRLRPTGGGEPGPGPAGYRTLAEYGELRDRDAMPGTVNMGEGLVDVSLAHIEELREVIEPWPPATE